MEEQKLELLVQSSELAEQRAEIFSQEETYKNKAGGKKRGKKFRLRGSIVAKVCASLLLLTGIVATVVSSVVIYIAVTLGAYTEDRDVVIANGLGGMAHRVAYTVQEYLENDDEESARKYLAENNAEIALMRKADADKLNNETIGWKSYEEGKSTEVAAYYSDLYYDVVIQTTFLSKAHFYMWAGEKCIFRVFFDPEFVFEDDISRIVDYLYLLYDYRYMVIGITAGSAFFSLLCYIFLLCGVGHKNGREEIVPGLFTGIYFDVFSAGTGILMLGIAYVLFQLISVPEEIGILIFAICGGTLALIWMMDFVHRMKLGKWWQNTLIYVVARMLWRMVKFVAVGIWKLVIWLPLVMTTVIVYLAICILEFMGCIFYVQAEGVMLWALEKVVLFFGVLYIALTCKKLQIASRELAEGKENCRVDTGRMFGAFQEHGENLNSLGQGISKAVAERMKSEHLKTELITNVSHDLKTPLTSIINYADLICEEKSENPKIEEYSEVLLRQSRRLKKLLEDLLDASKATTGNVEVNLAPCEVGVLLTQAVGEYQQRMEERGLELKAGQPEEPVRIMADGRHLWRVFDNLLNNICKYAQENSRVYLNLEQREEKVCIIFRNMSKYALDISPEELEERFVRGDKSRHMEGNGLGLSIAKSLVDLQNGKMDIVIDGDLFKVVLIFDSINE